MIQTKRRTENVLLMQPKWPEMACVLRTPRIIRLLTHAGVYALGINQNLFRSVHFKSSLVVYKRLSSFNLESQHENEFHVK